MLKVGQQHHGISFNHFLTAVSPPPPIIGEKITDCIMELEKSNVNKLTEIIRNI